MIVKFHQKTERIKGLSFHPNQPWLLVGLHSGVIQMIDYRLGRTLEEFVEHEGPVRSVQFHQSLSLFVSGSDDFTVRVWNYKTKKCQFVLRGHLDFVRCVHFHSELPWCVSASDDQTARIWNYQSRQMIAIVTGHSHYVMHCEFHPSKEFMITCSLDQTIRLWSITKLKQKFTQKNLQNDTANELELIQILEGHNQGVNWCTFHPTNNLILSASDDKKVKIWKFYETRAYELDTYNGHTNNVSSVQFLSFGDYFISNSEDKTLRIWDMNKKIEIDCFTNQELDRFWVCASNQNNYYFAGGSDSALYIFTLCRERPTIDITSQAIFFGSWKKIKQISLTNQQVKDFKNLQEIAAISDNLLQDNIEQIYTNIYETKSIQILIRLKQNSHLKQKNTSKFIIYEQPSIAQLFLGKSAIFIGKSKILKSKESGDLEIYNFETDSRTQLNFKADKLFPYKGGKAIFYFDQNIMLFDPLSNKILVQCSCTVEFQNIKKVLYNESYIVLQTKRGIYMFNNDFQKICHISEKINIKSIIFLSQKQNIILYSTKVHIKYLLINGDGGLIGNTKNVAYLVQVLQPIEKNSSGKKFRLQTMENGKLSEQEMDFSEMLFKQALLDKNSQVVQNFLKSHHKAGDSIISYLCLKGYSTLAYQLVTDKRAKFQLAIQSNNLEMAYRTCEDIKIPRCYQQLLEEAMRQGNHNIVEVCAQKLRASEQLAFLYTLTGQFDKLNVLSNIAKEQNQVNIKFQALLHLGNLEQRQKFLSECKLQHLSNLSKLVHGQEYEKNLNHQEDIDWLQSLNPQVLTPPTPIIKSNKNPIYSINWPHNYVGEDEAFKLVGEEIQKPQEEQSNNNQKKEKSKQNQQSEQREDKKPQKQDSQQNQNDDDENFEDCQWELDDIDLLTVQQNQALLDFKSLSKGYPDYKKSLLPYEQIVTDQYDQCYDNLSKNYNFQSFKPCKDYLKQIALQSIMEVSQIPFLNSAPLIIQQAQDKIYIPNSSKDLLKQGYKFTTDGKFQESLKTFKTLLNQCLFTQLNESLIQICLNYILAMKCELAKKDQEISRQIELACYMATCDLQPAHRSLTLRAAMSLAFKHKNYKTASHIAQYLIKHLESAPPGSQYSKPEVLENVRKVAKSCEINYTDNLTINFEPTLLNNGYKYLCADTLTLVKSPILCKFDKGGHSQSGIMCKICDLCLIK